MLWLPVIALAYGSFAIAVPIIEAGLLTGRECVVDGGAEGSYTGGCFGIDDPYDAVFTVVGALVAGLPPAVAQALVRRHHGSKWQFARSVLLVGAGIGVLAVLGVSLLSERG